MIHNVFTTFVETVCIVSVVISDVFTLVETEGIICEVIHDVCSFVEAVE